MSAPGGSHLIALLKNEIGYAGLFKQALTASPAAPAPMMIVLMFAML